MKLDAISEIIGLFAGLGVFLIGISYSWSAWRNGGNKYKEELIKDLKETVSVRDTTILQLNNEKSLLITSHQEQLTKLQTEITELRVRLDEQNKKLADYASILENRDPKTIAMLENIAKGIDKLNGHQVTQEANAKEVKDTLANKKKVLVEI